MNIPYFLLRLLPMWSWLCPKCEKEVKKNSHECPSCGEKYPMPLRVPPKLLKNLNTHEGKKALEAYVHKYIFPKVSPLHRAYLAQFFTVVFSDGFETGDLTLWTGTSTGVGCTVSGGDTNPYRGTYNFKSYVPAGTASGSSSVAYYGSLANAYLQIFARAYVKFDVLPEDDGDYHPFIGFWENTTSNNIARAGVMRSGADYRWHIRGISSGTTFTNYLGTATPVVNTWYCFELEVLIDNVNGEYRLYINGNLEIEVTGVDNNARNLNYFRIGFDSGIPPDLSNLNIRMDLVVLADARIGCLKGYVPWHRLKDRGGEARSHIVFRRGLKDRVGG